MTVLGNFSPIPFSLECIPGLIYSNVFKSYCKLLECGSLERREEAIQGAKLLCIGVGDVSQSITIGRKSIGRLVITKVAEKLS